ncbi:MAG TPA: hypothetical protein VH599_00780 [Ktedonobacterales bacterium]|jgi:hypothetical protein
MLPDGGLRVTFFERGRAISRNDALFGPVLASAAHILATIPIWCDTHLDQ